MTGTPGVSSSVASATSLVIRSRATTMSAAPQNRRRSAAFSILFLLFARDAEPSVRQRVKPLEVDLGPAIVAVAELLRIAVQPAQRLVHVPEIPALLGGEQELLLALH